MNVIRFVQFCAWLGVALTPAQRVLTGVAFDRREPSSLDEADREIAKQLFGPIDTVPAGARSVLVAVCGARAGKSFVLGALYSLWRALTADLSTLARGERASALIIAPDLRLARQCVRYSLGAAESEPAIARLIESSGADSFVLSRPDGARVAIEALPATRGGSAVRGRSYVSAVLDECAYFRDESFAVSDVDIFDAAAPRVLEGGMVVLCSTPYVEQGLLYSEFLANFAEPRTALAALAPTLLLRDDARTRAVVAREEERNPENARREFGAEFITGGAGLFFGPELLGPAMNRDLPVYERPRYGARATIGGDIGLERDASAFVAVHRDGDHVLAADALEMRPKKGKPLKLSEVVAAGCAFAERHGQHVIHVDHHVLGPAREYLPRGFQLLPVAGGQDAKAARFLEVREQLRQGNLSIVGPLARLAHQFGEIVSRPTPGGGTQIILPRRAGTHMDLAAAAVVAIFKASHRRVPAMMRALQSLSTLDVLRLEQAERDAQGWGL
jgi:hypothetical protein